MKRLALLLLLSPFLLSRLFAQDDTSTVKTPEISLAGGISFPYLPGQFQDYWKKGWNVDAGYGYSFSPGTIGYSSVLATMEYARSAFDITAFKSQLNLGQKKIAVTNNPTSVLSLMLIYKGTFSPSKRMLAPYFLFGFGYFHLSEGTIGVSGDTAFTITGQSRTAFGWTAGVGVELPITESIRFFIQAKSVLGVIDPVRQYFPISGGFSYRFPER